MIAVIVVVPVAVRLRSSVIVRGVERLDDDDDDENMHPYEWSCETEACRAISHLDSRRNAPIFPRAVLPFRYSPIHYIHQQIPQEELFAIYNIADVCLVTSVRDGMNLVSYEYVVAQQELADTPKVQCAALRTHGRAHASSPE